MVISFCILWFTIFLWWLFYYLIVIMRDVKDMVHGATRGIKKLEELAETLKDKIEKWASYLSVVGEVVKTAMVFVNKKKSEAAAKKPSRKEQKEQSEF